MALTLLSDSGACQTFWRRAILKNLHFWQGYLARHAADTPALEREWEGLVKGISLGLDLESGWPQVYELVTALSSFMERRGYWDVWQEILHRALATAPQAGDEAGEVTLAALLARLSQRQGRFQEMVAGYRRVIRLARRQGDRFNEARACTNLGYFYIEHGQWQRAEVLCCYALQVFEQLDSDHGRAHTENHLGVLYTWQSRWEEAEQRLQRACAIWQAMDDSQGLMYGFMNLGLLYLRAEEPETALFYSNKALDQAKVTGEELNSGTIYLNISVAHRLKGEFAKAENTIRQAEVIFRRFLDLSGITNVLENLGVLYLAQQEWTEATMYLKEALAGWRTLSNKYGEILTLLYLAECELARGIRQQARRYLKEAEDKLAKHPQITRHYQLMEQFNRIHQSLIEGQ